MPRSRGDRCDVIRCRLEELKAKVPSGTAWWARPRLLSFASLNQMGMLR